MESTHFWSGKYIGHFGKKGVFYSVLSNKYTYAKHIFYRTGKASVRFVYLYEWNLGCNEANVIQTTTI